MKYHCLQIDSADDPEIEQGATFSQALQYRVVLEFVYWAFFDELPIESTPEKELKSHLLLVLLANVNNQRTMNIHLKSEVTWIHLFLSSVNHLLFCLLADW